MVDVRTIDDGINNNFIATLHLNSNYRDRMVFPYSTEFVAQTGTIGNECSKIIPFVSFLLNYDVVNNYFYFLDDLNQGFTPEQTFYLHDNSMVGCYLSIMDGVTPHQYTITESTVYMLNLSTPIYKIYVAETIGALVAATFPGYIKLEKYSSSSTLAMVASTNKFIIPSLDSSCIGSYFWCCSSQVADTMQYSRITDFNSSISEITLQDVINFDALYPVIYYEISSTIISMNGPINVAGIQNSSEEYIVRLISLTLPGTSLINNRGMTLRNYPYVQVHVGNAHHNTSNLIFSNTIINGSFVVPIDDSSQNISSTFYRLKDCFSENIMSLNLLQPLYFGVYSDSGELIRFREDNPFPIVPDPSVQVAAVFRLIRRSVINKTQK